jgi:predicted transcriptional regulator of viral defense system
MNGGVRMRDAVPVLASKGLNFFTIDTLVETLGLDRPAAHQLAMRMVRANLARRIKRGLYALLPPEDWGDTEGFAMPWYVTAANLAQPNQYYLAYYTAMEIHQMLQHPLRTVFIAVTTRRRGAKVGPVTFRFVTLDKRRFFGAEDLPVEPWQPIRVATLERTFLDCVDRIDLCGGLEEVFRGFARRHGDLNPDRLLRFTYRLDKPVVTKRLGYLLEQVGHGDRELLDELRRAGGQLRHYVPLDPKGPDEGPNRDKRWEILVNADLKALRLGAQT